MSSWLCILNRTNFEIVKENLIWGVSDRHKRELNKANPGELCAFYLICETYRGERKGSAIGGILEVASESYEDTKPIFFPKQTISNHTSQEVYPNRIQLKILTIFNPEIPFKLLIPELTFITNKKKYCGHVMGKAMREIPESDMNLILKRHLN
jgi:predicted RNA-binding protein